MIQYNFGQGPTLVTDSSFAGYGLYIDRGDYPDWQAGWFNEQVLPSDNHILDRSHGHWKNIDEPLVSSTDNNINFLELLPVWQALLRFGPKYRDSCMVLL